MTNMNLAQAIIDTVPTGIKAKRPGSMWVKGKPRPALWSIGKDTGQTNSRSKPARNPYQKLPISAPIYTFLVNRVNIGMTFSLKEAQGWKKDSPYGKITVSQYKLPAGLITAE